MERKSITALKSIFEMNEVNEQFIMDLKRDGRKGVQRLIKTYENKKLKETEAEENFINMSRYEQKNVALGSEYIAGIDEAGRVM